MTVFGWLTELLSPERIAQGYRLTEDEDFVYLWRPGINEPQVFSSHGATMENIEAHITATLKEV